LSYLLFGRSLSQSSSSEANQAYDSAAAAKSIGIELAAQELGQRLGLEDVRIQEGENGTQTVVMGRYISPRIYVGYGVNATEALGSFHLNYLLTKHWTLETQTSAAGSGADLVFTLDSN
jgi:translocation and assembly module TamB